MAGEISLATRTEVLGAIRSRYREAMKNDKSRMLDEFVAMTSCHRKHAVRLLGQGEDASAREVPRGRRIYDDAVREALTVVWEASDRICGKRLKAALPSMVESLERHRHLDLDPDARLRSAGIKGGHLLQPTHIPMGGDVAEPVDAGGLVCGVWIGHHRLFLSSFGRGGNVLNRWSARYIRST